MRRRFYLFPIDNVANREYSTNGNVANPKWMYAKGCEISMSATIKQIAALAKVSPSTISRVFRGSPLVSERTRSVVLKASREHGYFPHSAARAMRGGKFNRVACVVTRFGRIGEAYQNSSGYLDAATDLLAQRGISVIYEPFHLLPIRLEFVESPRLFSELSVDGIIGFDTIGMVPDSVDEQIAQLRAPIVWINRTPRPGVTCVNCDDAANARLLVRHLIDLGHRRIGYYGIDELHYSMHERPAAVMAELRAAGLDDSGRFIAKNDAAFSEFIPRMLTRQPRLTALICYSFRDLYFVLLEASRLGIRVPEELSLCYFSSSSEISHHKPYHGTSVTVPEAGMVQQGIGRLLAAIDGEPLPEGETRIAGELVPGVTTAPPAKADA